MTQRRVTSASMAFLLLALATLVASAWATSAQAQTACYSITGNVRLQIGAGFPIPITTIAPPSAGLVLATPSATVVQLYTQADPKRMTIKVGAFTHPGTPVMTVGLGLFKAAGHLWQMQTGVNVSLPVPPPAGGPVLNVLSAGGRTGPATVTWCPGIPLSMPCISPWRCPTKGRVRYIATKNQFGGPISHQAGGWVQRALHAPGLPGAPCDWVTQPNCIAYFATYPPLQTGAIGGPFGHQTTTEGLPDPTGAFRIAATSYGLITDITYNGVGPGVANSASSWAAPWTTGQVRVSVFTGTGTMKTTKEKFTLSGTDQRVNGVGVISLVAGAVSNRYLFGPNANRGWLNITVPEPAVVVGAASAFLLLAACHSLVRRRSR